MNIFRPSIQNISCHPVTPQSTLLFSLQLSRQPKLLSSKCFTECVNLNILELIFVAMFQEMMTGTFFFFFLSFDGFLQRVTILPLSLQPVKVFQWLHSCDCLPSQPWSGSAGSRPPTEPTLHNAMLNTSNNHQWIQDVLLAIHLTITCLQRRFSRRS